MPFGEALRKIRRSKQMTQRFVADAINMDYAYFSRLENDRFEYQPSRETVEKIATALKCSDAERSELLGEAGRIDEEMEEIARSTNTRPELNELFRTAAGLPPDRIQELIEIARKKANEGKKIKA